MSLCWSWLLILVKGKCWQVGEVGGQERVIQRGQRCLGFLSHPPLTGGLLGWLHECKQTHSLAASSCVPGACGHGLFHLACDTSHLLRQELCGIQWDPSSLAQFSCVSLFPAPLSLEIGVLQRLKKLGFLLSNGFPGFNTIERV